MKVRTRRCWSRLTLILVGLVVALAGSAPASAEVLPGPTGWPLPGPIEVSRPFDPPRERWGAGHRGVDLASAAGSPVLAAAAGTVTYAQTLAGRGVVVVDHGDSRTTYEPVTATVAVGARVSTGRRIGTLQPGHCPPQDCLHWGWLRGETYLDPLRLGGSAAAPGGDGRVRLVGEAQRKVAERLAAERAAAAAAAATAGVGGGGTTGPPGGHGFVPPVAGPITSPYGMRLHPVLRVTKLHDGTDFGAGCGMPIRAPYPGRVSQVFFNAGYGNRLMIDHGTIAGRHVVSGYNHASSYSVGPGQQVAQGQVIGSVGSTGYSTGCHLHLMLWLDGEVVNPMSWW